MANNRINPEVCLFRSLGFEYKNLHYNVQDVICEDKNKPVEGKNKQEVTSFETLLL